MAGGLGETECLGAAASVYRWRRLAEAVNDGMWRSLAAHLLWEQGVGSSNLPIPTTNESVATSPW